jgi:translation initiation factor 2B subunit (eIF-2B alpha/beta/delta family)
MDFTETNPLPKVKVKNSLKSFITSNVIVNNLIKEIQTIPNYQNLKYDMELVERICQTIEEKVKKGNSKSTNKIDKKQLVINVLQQLFQLNPTEIQIVDKTIEYFVSNGIVKNKTIFKKLFSCLVDQLPTLPK